MFADEHGCSRGVNSIVVVLNNGLGMAVLNNGLGMAGGVEQWIRHGWRC